MSRGFTALCLLLLSSVPALAQSTIHRPIGTGDCTPHVGGDVNDASAVVWIPPARKWIMTDQRFFFVFSESGVMERQSTGSVTCKGATEHEGFALVDSPRCSNDANRRCDTSRDCNAPGTCTAAGASSDVLWVQDENLGLRCTNNPGTICSDDFVCGGSAGQNNLCKASGAMCRYSIAAILGMGQGGNASTPVALEEVWVTDVPNNSSEGLVFVPDPSAPGRYGGRFFWSEQANARWRELALDPAQPTMSWGPYKSFPSGCAIGGDLSDGYYDFVRGRFYSQSDGGNRYTVHSGDFSTCYASVTDPAICKDNGFEGLAFGGGRFAYVDDWTGHVDDAFNGLYLFEDDFCGDEARVSTETCDGADLAGKDCATASAAECFGGHCGSGWSGTLTCRPDCAKFDDSGCTTGGPGQVQNLRRTDHI
ncbi:MAG TPA: hypothetical protein VFC25_00230 [Verrucomicrobiae bacterium]|nr:hypothetical protein [Verrucomicrobiae bacterium]